MVNQISKFAPNLADVTQPLRELLVKDNQWVRGEPQQRAFRRVKDILTSSPVLALFDPNLETTISADVSSFGLGAVLLQRQSTGDLKPIAYISTSDTHRAEVCSNWEGGPGLHLGMWTSLGLPRWPQIPHPDWSQAAGASVQLETSGRAASPSSPYFPQSNGEAERAVGTIKNLLKKSGDPYLALLSYHTTPLQLGYSPSELLMSRVLRSTVPTTRKQRAPKVVDHHSSIIITELESYHHWHLGTQFGFLTVKWRWICWGRGWPSVIPCGNSRWFLPQESADHCPSTYPIPLKWKSQTPLIILRQLHLLNHSCTKQLNLAGALEHLDPQTG